MKGKRPRVLVLLKRSLYRRYVEQEQDALIEGLIRSGDPTVSRLIPGHMDHEETIDEVRAALEELGTDAVYVEMPYTTPVGPDVDLVVTVGGDGTLLSASHQLGLGTPLLGVNSAPEHSVGFFCAAKKGHVRETLLAALRHELRPVKLTRMRVDLNDMCIHRRVLNEALFCHASPAATSRYILRVTAAEGDFEEVEQKSSGLWIGPAAGSTAAQRSAGGEILPLGSPDLQFVVREPYTPYGKPMHMTRGRVEARGHLTLRNKMRQAKIFLDGEHTVYDVAIGDVITMRPSEEPLTVLGLTRNGG